MYHYTMYGLSVLVNIVGWSLIVATGDVQQTCLGMDRDCVINYYKKIRLPRRDPVKVGHISSITLEKGQENEVKTLSVKPPVFEIRNFLSPDECDHIIKLAKERGLEMSLTMDQDLFEDEKYFVEDQKDLFDYYDYNKDGYMDLDEVIDLMDTELDFSPDREDVLNMFQDTKFDRDGDGLVSLTEFTQKDVKAFMNFIAKTKEEKPYTKSRNSNQTWLETGANSSSVLHSLRKRLQKLTQLPMLLLNASESLQVVSYGARGHYNCHLDSDDVEPDRKCCHLQEFESSDCRICRYLTALYFLNDVEEGGETAFPVADNETFDEDIWQRDETRACNVGRNCHKSNLRVKPEKGKAILWYSHLIDEDSGWLGESDPYSSHGGCDVKKGIKWIANNWISVSENRSEDIEFWIKEHQDSENNADTGSEDTDDENHDEYRNHNHDDDYDEVDEILKAVEEETDDKEQKLDNVFDSVRRSNIRGSDEMDLHQSYRKEL